MRILLTTQGSLGDLHPYLALAAGLKTRGHQVAIATSNFYKAKIEGLGLEHRSLAPNLSAEDEVLVKAICEPKNGSEFIFRTLVMGSLRESYDDTFRAAEGMDVLVSHPLTIATPLVAEARKMKWASSVLAPLSFLSIHEPTEISGRPWMSGLTRQSLLMRKLINLLGRTLTRGWFKPVFELCREKGLTSRGHPLFEGQHSPHLGLALYSKVLGAPQPDWPPHTVVTGFCVHDTKEGHDALSPELVRFLDAGDPPLVFTLGSTAVLDAGTFYVESMMAARSLKRRAVLICGKTPPRGVLEPGILTVEYAPYSQLFPRAEAVVCSAGIGTIGQTLRAGVPFLLVPFGNDQPDNAARCERLGVSRTLPRARYRRDTADVLLHDLLADAEAKKRSKACAATVAAEDGVAAACAALEGLGA